MCKWYFLVVTFALLCASDSEFEDNDPGSLQNVEGKIKLRVQLPNGSFAGPQLTNPQRKTVQDDMKVTLAGTQLHYSTLVRQDGKFVLFVKLC